VFSDDCRRYRYRSTAFSDRESYPVLSSDYNTAGAVTAAKLYPKELLPQGVSIAAATEDGTAGHKGLITELVPSFTTTADEIFVCGPMPMLRYMADNRKSLKLTDKPVSISLEMRMACGWGFAMAARSERRTV